MTRIIVSLAAILLACGQMQAATAAKLPPTMKVGKLELVLNGEGSREKYFLDLYAAGLYLVEPEAKAAAIIDADQPMAIRIAILSKFVSQEKLVAALDEGFRMSTDDKLTPIRAEIEQFRACFSDEIQRGDVFDLLYLPGKGVMVYKQGKRQGEPILGLEFKRALFGIWLSERPADPDLKQALLRGTKRR